VLRRFPGTVLLVSHDRYLVQAIATHIWRVDGDELRPYKGNYEEYLRLREIETAEKRSEMHGGVDKALAQEEERERARQERRQRRAVEKQAERAAAIEAQIAQIESRLTELGAQLESASLAGDVARVQELGLEYQRLDAELHHMMASWTELV
jgi:ATP-binding cassette subfamily F protein 3